MIPAATRTRSPRFLAGSRANKHRPVARRTHRHDRYTATCNRMSWHLIYDIDHWHKPDHAARAVSITMCFAGAGLFADADRDRAVKRIAVLAGNAGTSAAPLTQKQRLENYAAQNGWSVFRFPGTPAQWRRLRKKARRSRRAGEAS